jgi:hypothetical protein
MPVLTCDAYIGSNVVRIQPVTDNEYDSSRAVLMRLSHSLNLSASTTSANAGKDWRRLG